MTKQKIKHKVHLFRGPSLEGPFHAVYILHLSPMHPSGGRRSLGGRCTGTGAPLLILVLFVIGTGGQLDQQSRHPQDVLLSVGPTRTSTDETVGKVFAVSCSATYNKPQYSKLHVVPTQSDHLFTHFVSVSRAYAPTHTCTNTGTYPVFRTYQEW